MFRCDGSSLNREKLGLKSQEIHTEWADRTRQQAERHFDDVKI